MKTLTFTISDELFETFYACFERDRRMPQVHQEIDGELQYNEDGTALMVDQYEPLEWVRMLTVAYLKRIALNGKQKLVLDGNPADQAIIEDILNNL